MKTIAAFTGHSHKGAFLKSFAFLLVFLGILAAAHAQSLKLPKLRPPHGEIGPTFWEQHHWQVITPAVAVLLLGTLLILWLRRPKPVVVVPPEIVARRSLEGLRGRPEDAPLTVEVSHIIRNYLISVFMLPPDELTTAEVLRALQARPQIDPGLVKSIGTFLRRCDELKFGRNFPQTQTGLAAEASDLVDAVERQRPRPTEGAVAQPPTKISAPTAA